MGSFVLADDTSLPGMLNGQYNVTVSDVCELQAPSWAFNPDDGDFYGVEWKARHVFFRSTATRDAGLLVGLTQAVITQDVMIQPIKEEYLFPAIDCF